MKLKAGDTPTVRKGLIRNIGYGGHVFTQSMAKMQGKNVTIRSINKDDNFYIIEEMNCLWTDEMFEDEITLEEIYKIEDKYKKVQNYTVRDYQRMSIKDRVKTLVRFNEVYPQKTNRDVIMENIAKAKTAKEFINCLPLGAWNENFLNRKAE